MTAVRSPRPPGLDGGFPRLELAPADRAKVVALTRSVAAEFRLVENEDFLLQAAVIAHDLPLPVRRFLNEARLREDPVFGIVGYEIEDDMIGPTPRHWRSGIDSTRSLPEEFLLVLYASLLGEVFSMSLLQGGKLLNDVIPIRGHEERVTAASSESALVWHTEEAGLDVRPDYQVFLCLRNRDQVPTTVALASALEIPPRFRDVLFEPRFVVSPLGPLTDDRVMATIMAGSREDPYICLDPVFTEARDADAEAEAALAAAISAVDAALVELPQGPGDVWVIDNLKAVHGRPAFTPRYDQGDRWLKRVKVMRDLRKSRHRRETTTSRIVEIDV